MSWTEISLGELCGLITDGKHGDCKNQDDSGFYFLSAKDVKEGKLNYSNARQITHDDFLETHRRTDLMPGDVLITNSGTIGRMAIAKDLPETGNTTFQKSVAVLKPIREKILPQFLFYLLMANKVRLVNTAAGSAQKNLLLGELRRFEVSIPELEIQSQIVSVLSAYDDLIENNRRRITLLEEAAKLLYREWFVQFRFPGAEHAKIVDGVPEGWERMPLMELADMVMGQSPKSEFYNDYGEGLPFHQGVTNYGFRFVTDTIYSSKTTKLAERNDILFSVRAPVGRINITLNKMVLGRGLSALCSKSGSQSFLLYQLKSYFFKEDLIGGGAIYAATNKKQMEKLGLLQPPTALIDEFENVSVPIDSQIKALTLSTDEIVKARDLLLPRLMDGRLEI